MSTKPTAGETPPPPATAKSSRRRDCRAAAMQFLYMWDVNPGVEQGIGLQDFFSTQEHPRDYYAFAEELINGTLSHQAEIDELIKKHAHNWAFNRIARVDLAILRLGIYELLHRRDIPPVVTINEAIELGKSYSNPDSRRFLNGMLDRVKDSLDRPSRTAAE
ncbi:MAG TPA: transcription antitermination factor NusB [Opitutales bacterium]|nr:transcription antitermination factor NusB [Opitutales bacterium]